MPTDAQNELLLHWNNTKHQLAAAKEAEMNARKAVTDAFFDADAKEGMNTLELGNGYELKYQNKFTYTLNDSNDAVKRACDKLASTGNEGGFIAERLVTWKPTLSLSEYRKLDEKYRVIIDEVLTIKQAAPALEIKEPKA